jgi:hypothetical protein
MDDVTAQVVLGALAAYLLQWLKKASWFPVLTDQSTKLWKVTCSAIVAAGTALGLSFDFQATQGVLTISGLTAANVWNAVMAFGLSFLAQHSSYELLVRNGKKGAV